MKYGQVAQLKKVIVIGGGAAGMAAAIYAAKNGARAVLFEKNEKLGKKLYITGKGRCNFTNVCGSEELLNNVVTNPKFLFSSFGSFSGYDAVDFFESLGVRTKTERGRRAFPESDHSSDIIKALEKEMKRLGVEIRLCTRVKEVIQNDGRAGGVVLQTGERVTGDAVVVATGGLSYPSTGSTGDGFVFAKEAGMKVTETRPALVPLEVKEDFAVRLQGLSLKNVSFTVKKGKKVLYSDFGEMLFTHFGISGPLVISASSVIGKRLEKEELCACIDLKPALTFEQLDERVLRDFSENKNRQFKNAVTDLFPSKLTPVMVELSGIPQDMPANSVSKGQRQEFVRLIKCLPLTITALRPYSEAVVTQGGVSVKDIDPSTMESKTLSGLYFSGEVIDVDAFTGGYNLQIAWATARKAGISAAGKKQNC